MGFTCVAGNSIYHKNIGKWKLRPGCDPVLQNSFDRARLREHYEMNWKSPVFSSSGLTGITPQLEGIRATFEGARRDMLDLSVEQSPAKLFRTIFGKEPNEPQAINTVITPFGITFIMNNEEIFELMGDIAFGRYMCDAQDQEKILSPAYKNRVCVVSTIADDLSYSNLALVKGATSVENVARHENEHMYLAMHRLGVLSKTFIEGVMIFENDKPRSRIKRLWDSGHPPAVNRADILRRTDLVIQWWTDLFLESIVKNELIAYLVNNVGARELKTGLNWLIGSNVSRLQGELNNFVLSRAREAYKDPDEYQGCLGQFRAQWKGLGIEPLLNKQKDEAVSVMYDLLGNSIPLRVAIELAENIPLKEWQNVMKGF